ncbi:MAG: winged helix-turn-helix transcriptional regulator [Wenyingzhuangia sp.]|uniref:Lrp/AsnC family transcriptional regulator n=2 Tax=Wenyingzhuangia sp. TaxID=1964193 RepID=UPI00321B3C3A
MKKFNLDQTDHQILNMLVENARTPFTDIAKKLQVSAGTIHVRVKKMEDEGLIKGSTLILDYEKMNFDFIAHVGITIENTSQIKSIISSLEKIPYVTIAYITTGQFNVFCKIRTRDTKQAKEIIFSIDEIAGVKRTETMISMEECINDKSRMMNDLFKIK